jgi:hypothetical protein
MTVVIRSGRRAGGSPASAVLYKQASRLVYEESRKRYHYQHDQFGQRTGSDVPKKLSVSEGSV